MKFSNLKSIIPLQLRNRIRLKLGLKVYNPILEYNGKKFIFIHIVKTAGTSISKIVGEVEHRTAQEIIEIIGKKKFRKLYSFAFVRNPWDRMLSIYKYRTKHNINAMGESPIDFNSWIVEVLELKNPKYYDVPKFFANQFDWISGEDGRPVVSYIGKFESLNDDFEKIKAVLSINESLGHHNATYKTEYQDLYNSRSRELVSQHFEKDINFFGYSFI